jgi:hypothetical protein
MLTLAAAPSVASADDRKIYLNGIDLTNVDVSDQSFAGCVVKFDADGNVHITVKGLEMKTVEGDGTSNTSKKTDKKAKKKKAKKAKKAKKVKKSELGTAPGTYYLIAKPTARKDKAAPYKVSVYINGKLVKLVQPDGGMVVMDISKYVGPGLNTARLIAAHSVSKSASKSSSIDDSLEIVIGKGELKKGTVVIRAAYIEYSRNGAETRDFDDKFKFDVKRR